MLILNLARNRTNDNFRIDDDVSTAPSSGFIQIIYENDARSPMLQTSPRPQARSKGKITEGGQQIGDSKLHPFPPPSQLLPQPSS